MLADWNEKEVQTVSRFAADHPEAGDFLEKPRWSRIHPQKERHDADYLRRKRFCQAISRGTQ